MGTMHFQVFTCLQEPLGGAQREGSLREGSLREGSLREKCFRTVLRVG